MPNPTPELGLEKAIDSDDTADYLDTSLANSLTTLDSLFNNVSGHIHGGAHQGGPISSIPSSAIPAGSITSAMIQDGTIQTYDLADGSVTSAKIADGTIQAADIATGVITTTQIADGTIQGADIAASTITYDKIATFASGPRTNDWFRNEATGSGIINEAVNQGIAFDGSGGYAYPSGDRLVTATATQTLSNKTLTSATENNPTLAGTVSGGPTWAAGQTFPGVVSTGTMTAANGYFISNANNAQILPSSRAGHPNAEIEINNYLYVVGDINAGGRMYAISFNQTSDPRLKTDMTTLADEACMQRVRADVPVQTYQVRSDPEQRQHIGFSAPDVYASSPEFVSLDEDRRAVGLNYAGMAALLWGALRQLDQRCQANGI